MNYALITAAAMCSAIAAGAASPLQYPAAPQDGTVYHVSDVEVSDIYRPLEDDSAPATLAWVEAENALTRSVLDAVPFRDRIRSRLTALMDYEKTGLPWREHDGLYYFYINDGLRNQAVLYRATEPYGKDAEVFIDPNTLSDDGTVALTGVYMSPDGRYTAYTVSRSGSDWTEIYVMDTATRRLMADHIVWAKFTGAAWKGSDGFYYSAYERPADGRDFSAANEYHKVYYHRIGTPQSADKVVYENRERPLYFHSVATTDDQRWLIVMGGGQGFGNSLYVRPLADPAAQWVTIEPSMDYTMEPLDTDPAGRLLVLTSAGAPRNRLVRIDPACPARDAWATILPEDPQGGVLTSVQRTGADRFIASYDRDASTHLSIHALADGRRLADVGLPTLGTASVSASSRDPRAFYSFTSFTYPSSVYTLDSTDGSSSLLRATRVDGLNPDDYVTEQIFYTSKDGTRVPMFIVRRKDVRPDGSNPVYLYGYGGFNITLRPSFSPSRMLWLEDGGIYAQAGLRGGAEYGEAWHEAGTKLKKQNVFDDFIAAAEYMIDQGWTRPDLLVAEGGSNGGLLVGAVVNQRPDLFRVAIPRVGVMDMMRYHLFTIGWNWASDYGTADDSPAMARYLLGYSPLHTIRSGVEYPAVLITTADHDDRVVPAHSFKYAAALQAADTGSRPKLIRIDSKAGHGAGKPVAKVIDEWVDIYSFIYSNLGRTPAAAR